MSEIFKIIKIVDDYSVVINAGANECLQVGEQLEVFQKGDPVIDPDTNEELGTLDLIKARIKVSVVYERMSLCANAEEENLSFIAASSLANLMKSGPKPLQVNAEDISGGLNGSKKIKVGDLVRKTLG